MTHLDHALRIKLRRKTIEKKELTLDGKLLVNEELKIVRTPIL